MRDISPRAAALLPALLRQLEAGPVTAGALEDWWAARSGVLRVELFRALRSLVDSGQVVALDGRRWALAGYREPDPTPPDLPPVARTIYESLRKSPATMAGLRRVHPDMNYNSLRGRVSELGERGHITRRADGVWEVVR